MPKRSISNQISGLASSPVFVRLVVIVDDVVSDDIAVVVDDGIPGSSPLSVVVLPDDFF